MENYTTFIRPDKTLWQKKERETTKYTK